MEREQKAIYLVRHLPTSMNREAIYMGRINNPGILEEGRSDLQNRIKYLLGDSPLINTSFYSSPMLRCQETVGVVKDSLGLANVPTQVLEGFNETDLGELSGLTGPEARQKFPDVVDKWMHAPEKVTFPGGESYQDVQLRAWEALLTLVDKREYGWPIIICTHVDIIKLLIFKIIGVPMANKRNLIIENGSVSLILMTDEGLKVAGINVG